MISIDGSLVIIIAIIVFLFFALNRLLFRPVQTVMDERKQRIDGPQKEATQTLEEHGRQVASLQASLADARRRANAHKAERRGGAVVECERVVEESSQEARARVDRQSSIFEEQKQKARTELTSHIQTLAAKIAGRFIRG